MISRRNIWGFLLLVLLVQRPASVQGQDQNPFSSVGYEEQRGVVQLIASGPLGTACLERSLLYVDGLKRYDWQHDIKVQPKNRLFFSVATTLGKRLFSTILTEPLPKVEGEQQAKRFDRVQPLPQQYLSVLRRRNRLPLARKIVEDRDQAIEALMYFKAISLAHRTPVDVFLREEEKEKKAEGELRLVHFLTEPELHHGRVVRFDGYLARVTELGAPPQLKEYGIKHLYEVWVANKDELGNGRAIVMVCTSLPKGIKPQESYGKVVHRVSIVGYFFKLYAYKSKRLENTDLARVTPLIVGHLVHTSTLAKKETDSGSTVPALAGLAGLVALGMIVVGGLTWWAKRGDSEVASRIAAARRKAEYSVAHTSEPATEEEEPDPGLLGEDWPPTGPVAPGDSGNEQNRD